MWPSSFFAPNVPPEAAEHHLAKRSDLSLIIKARRGAREFLRKWLMENGLRIEDATLSPQMLDKLYVRAHLEAETYSMYHLGPSGETEQRVLFRIEFANEIIRQLEKVVEF